MAGERWEELHAQYDGRVPEFACVCIAEMERRLDRAESERGELEQQIRGHCALLTGHSEHTDNVADCLGHVHQQISEPTERAEKAEAERDELRRPRPFEAWVEDDGAVLWFTLPICEPPYCGTPLDDDWPWLVTPDQWVRWIPLPRLFRDGEPSDA